MSQDEFDEYDSLFDDVPEEALALAESNARASKAASPAVAAAPVRPSVYKQQRQRPKPTILRPPQNPVPRPIQPLPAAHLPSETATLSAPVHNAPAKPSPLKKPRLESNGPALGRYKEWVDPNPFADIPSQRPSVVQANSHDVRIGSVNVSGPAAAPQPRETNAAEEDMPEISVMPNGTYAASRPAPIQHTDSARILPPPRPPERDLSALKEWGEGKNKATTTGKPVAWATGYLSGRPDDAEAEEQRNLRLELQKLQAENRKILAEKQDMQKSLETTQAKLKKSDTERMSKIGENTIIRRKLEMVKKEHEKDMTTEHMYKEGLQARLTETQRELRLLNERMNMNEAFRKQEAETARRTGPSQRPNTRRASTVAPPVVSPSTIRKAPVAHGFPGFRNAFEEKPASSPVVDGKPRETVTPRSSPQRNKFVTPNRAIATDADEMFIDGGMVDAAQAQTRVASGPVRSSVQHDFISAALMHRTLQPGKPTAESKTGSGDASARSRTSAIAPPREQADGLAVGASVGLLNDGCDMTADVATLQYLAGVKIAGSSDHLRDLLIALGVHPLHAGSSLTSANDIRFVQRACSALDGLVRDLSTGSDMTPLCRLLSLIACIAFRCRLAADYWLGTASVFSDAANGMEVDASPSSKLVGLLTQILAKYCSPSAAANNKINDKFGSSGRSKKEKSRRTRTSTARQTLASKAGRAVAPVQANVVELDEQTCLALTCAVLEVLEALVWHSHSFSAETFVQLLSHESAMSHLLSPRQSTIVLKRTIGMLCILASYPDLFRPIVGIQLGSAPDLRESKVPIFERVSTLMLRPTSIAMVAEDHALDFALTSLVTTLSTKHVDSITLITLSFAFLPTLISKIHEDACPCWDKDGLLLSDQTKTLLELSIDRLAANVHLFYYLASAPTSMLLIGEFFAQSSYASVQDHFYSAFGMLAFAGVPEWARDKPSIISTLSGLAELAQDVLEDVCPNELDSICECFQIEANDDSVENGVADGAQDARMDVDPVNDEAYLELGDDELAMLDMSQSGSH
ncbi:hypothetical protein OIV83_005843 [Microbotryomycetes sp. JL201]|nr:hypothetical protein OIV83_005843 [Microbotryomycetes sp. JL201]